jgi:hypothetical protein
MADDYRDTYRARIVWKYRAENADWDWGDDRTSRYVDDPDAEEHVTCYGPYANKGTAKAMRQHFYRDYYAEDGRIQVISSKVQKASITWEDVDE